MRPLVYFLGLALVFWLVLLAMAWQGGMDSVYYCNAAFALCLVPALLTMAISLKWGAANPDSFLLYALGGSMIRMMVVLGTALVLVMNFADSWPSEFLYWVTLFYLFLLGVEVTLLVRHQTQTARVLENSPSRKGIDA